MKIKVFVWSVARFGDSINHPINHGNQIGESDLLIHFLQNCHLVLFDTF